MSGPGSGGPFYFHYVEDATVAFSSACYTQDEYIYAFELKHDEGQIPVLELEIETPQTGLLAAGRKQWAWFSWWNGTAVVPLFLGRLVAVPSDLFAQVIKVQFIARAPDYISRKQALAETLKIAPYYDPAFLDASNRDSPDPILEGWSALYHIDRTTLDWTISDILVGEDGTVTFDADTAFYDDLSMTIGQPPFTSIRVEMSAKWAQIWSNGALDPLYWNFSTVNGDKIISEWPKVTSSVGGGYYVISSGIADLNGVYGSSSQTSNFNWQNKEKTHAEGDTMSLTVNYTYPSFAHAINPPPWSTVKSAKTESGVGHNSVNIEYEIKPLYDLYGVIQFGYKANRKREELLGLTLKSDLQSILSDPNVQEDSEVIELNTVDLSQPMITPTNWTVLAGQPVDIGQVCFPNNPSLPARSAYFICVGAGTCGAIEPTFNTTLGDSTTDGTATWACLGSSLPSIGDWQAATDVSLGTIIAPSTPTWYPYSSFMAQGYPAMSFGVPVSQGTIIRTNDGSSYQMCLVAGVTGPMFLGQWWSPPAFSTTWGDEVLDGSVVWVSLGTEIPAGAFHVCIQAGTTTTDKPPVPPPWSGEVGHTVDDGTAQWYSIGSSTPSLSIPAGGRAGNVGTRSYFTTDRGRRSLEYGLMVARAHLRNRSRCVDIAFSAPFSSGVDLSCRKSARINDPRISGGTATGKIKSYSLSCNGDSGEALTKVTVGCAVGKGGTATAVDPTDHYVASGYVTTGYSEGIGGSILSGDSDVTYDPPLENPNDDGLTFPLTLDDVVLSDSVLFSSYVDLQLRNLTGSSFTTLYEIATTPLKIPQQINLG